jgi:hypothetical protein
LDVPVEVFYEGRGAPLPDMEEWDVVLRYRRLDDHGRRMIGVVMNAELERVEAMRPKS